ncbi:hypothetical protein RHGRI_024659 [Rhododendron griersonianum]|uniref:Uncharacterized protein n=1 Tax=Rhododendron griersonianum TaxID=479676 RepID=A0AAV6JBJ0_9ERIC|nr:hypothetical protein RHGRI_024659 [Rhododendron griersonianum]
MSLRPEVAVAPHAEVVVDADQCKQTCHSSEYAYFALLFSCLVAFCTVSKPMFVSSPVIPLYLKTLTPSDIHKSLVIYSDVGQVMFNEAMDRGVFDAHTNTFPIHLINGAGGETIETVMNILNNRCRVNWNGFLALNPELIVGQQVAFSKQWVQVLGVATLSIGWSQFDKTCS